jgi:hypothetical protein
MEDIPKIWGQTLHCIAPHPTPTIILGMPKPPPKIAKKNKIFTLVRVEEEEERMRGTIKKLKKLALKKKKNSLLGT